MSGKSPFYYQIAYIFKSFLKFNNKSEQGFLVIRSHLDLLKYLQDINYFLIETLFIKLIETK